jgi:RNA polymerase sigma-70 factor (ECF subfamily)
MFRRRQSDPGAPRRARRGPGDPDAFAADVLGLLDPLYAMALRLTGNRADAEDLVQDTLVKALRFSDRFERGTNLKAWLYTILHNTWRNRRRDAARDTVEADSERVEQAASGPDGPAAFDTPEQILIRDTLDADLKAALDALPEAFREAVWLRDVEEFSYAEIAAMIGVPIGTVMSRISRGRRLLFERLGGARQDLTPGATGLTRVGH